MKTLHSVLFALFVIAFSLHGQEEKMMIDLRGNWKFEIGDQKKFAEPSFDDAKWNEIFVPSDWENEGYPGYDGYGWYRKTITIPSSARGKKLFIHLIADDVCAIYLNGNLVGEGGQFPPHFETAYNIEHKIYLPVEFLRYDKPNVIAVRVYDDYLNGGIVKGKVGIFEHDDRLPYVVQFPERWKFKKGDNEEWKDPSVDDSKWDNLLVPAAWDFQGYRDYDGFGWYRVSVDIPSNKTDEKLVLLLGRIDDIDETYLNGELIGSTGRIRSNGTVGRIREEYRELRAYVIPRSALKPGQKNVIAVRVFDNFKVGGIYEGPIGIVTERDYRRWESKYGDTFNTGKTSFERFMDKLFNE